MSPSIKCSQITRQAAGVSGRVNVRKTSVAARPSRSGHVVAPRAVPQKVVQPEKTVSEETKLVSSLEQSLAQTNLNEADLKAEVKYAIKRDQVVQKHFPGSLSVDDFIFRLEMSLNAFGFDGENTIAVVNLCRDESTNIFRNKFEEAFPLIFNIHGLGANITCGVTGLKAGLSHSPESITGRHRYIFVSCAHIGIDSQGGIGNISRPGQKNMSCACGAMVGAMGQFKAQGVEEFIVRPGGHDPDDPEFSMFKQTVARRMLQEGKEAEDVDLVELTKVAERAITAELEKLIPLAVDPEKADYAIVTGVQIHNTGMDYAGEEPNLEFIQPTTVSVVMSGERVDLDLSFLPAAAPRQIRLLTGNPATASPKNMCVSTGNSTLSAVGVHGPSYGASMPEGQALKSRDTMFQNLLSACEESL
mmetsp:Transcript_27609/g.65507  ORF Transcript_27609/g.65507 Transcript_27609/m.65507 type:complete len:417 (+) Transcript_27609:136-1386(+)